MTELRSADDVQSESERFETGFAATLGFFSDGFFHCGFARHDDFCDVGTRRQARHHYHRSANILRLQHVGPSLWRRRVGPLVKNLSGDLTGTYVRTANT